ncbi:fungal-specific transcription factor domain-containing protein [Sodiomyces alkalinus F11]|uniref:Fungal-specific transcription factor domain-containing protein n=1 Tax=Sodiomyces alkalinus (strain CBS 110278 / VKM F-3762 / F11) TaxID=1314773 RepID=A0A3N2PWY0_SODAK|nr:fungal-specific transcription factor domain-containing protein [Sodiomyces alkalinus F11]ROT38994.1 fungal-specific transcription factor domain-containing protein [Sodiomyces alkalinus F11]
MEESQTDGQGASGPDEAPEPSFPTRRACDACRSRKVRCNRESPCSHCLQAKIECTHADSRPREKRTRVLITPQYERKIDLIDRRLEGVIRLLEDLKTNLPASNTQPQPPTQNFNDSSHAGVKANPTATISTSTCPCPTPPNHALPHIPGGSVIEGDSSLTAHSVFANEFLQKVVNTESLQDASLEMRETLDSLHHIVNALKQPTASSEMTYPNARRLPRPSSKHGSEMPPITKAVAMIRLAKSHSLVSTTWMFELIPMQHFSEVCLGVYFADDYSEADFISANAGLHCMFQDYANMHAAGSEKEEYLRFARMCRENLETALANLPLHLPTTSDSIIALLFGTFYTIEISKPSLAWALISKSSELCQTLGYHRASSFKNDTPVERKLKLMLFWSTYFLEKSLSLRLGRASTIQDWDVTTPLPTPTSPDDSPFMAYCSLWVKAAGCQGDIYQQLYSPDSLTQPDHVREARVRRLVSQLEDISAKVSTMSAEWVKKAKQIVGDTMVEFFLVSDDVLYLSLLTLVYRAAPRPASSPTTFSDECIKAARATLARHQDCMEVLEKSNSIFFPTYVHWTLLFSPFIPFIVIFCQVIETLDQADLARLHQFVTSIQSAPALSEAAAKMHRLFQVLYSVALRYVEFRIATPPAGQLQASAEMEGYLAALGFPSTGLGDAQQHQQQQNPHEEQSQQTPDFGNSPFGQGVPGNVGALGEGQQRAVNPMMWMGNGAQLEDWFYSNQQMMGLLQQSDFTFPHQN